MQLTCLCISVNLNSKYRFGFNSPGTKPNKQHSYIMKDLQVFVYRFVNVEVKRLNMHGHSDIKNWENIVLG